jgi:hypothetical protein
MKHILIDIKKVNLLRRYGVKCWERKLIPLV